MKKLRISFLHIAPVTNNVDHNRKLVERGVKTAAVQGAQWVVTPELCIPGYLFMKSIGTDWILPQPDPWMNEFPNWSNNKGLQSFYPIPNEISSHRQDVQHCVRYKLRWRNHR
ncbi:MAG: hypothetical protein Ct9H300mP11_14230 [Chloroflexota bacterium]|nr:MAG: hypothetical protein Ct9H300mP11_14230 [Chloroflexota bacterium]